MKMRVTAVLALTGVLTTLLVTSTAAAEPVTTEEQVGQAVPSVEVSPQTDGQVDILPRHVPDIPGQFAALALRPDGLGFNLGDSPEPRLCKHYQGMARVQGPDGTNYMLVSRSGNAHVTCPLEDDDDGNLLIVEMGSREHSGERLRSNRFARDWYMEADEDLAFGTTPPDSRDVVADTIHFDGAGWPSFGHPGGMQVIGEVLALALEHSYVGAPDQIMFLDVSDPLRPSRLSSFQMPDQGSDDFGAGLVGITTVRTGDGGCCRYLMVVTGKSNKDVRFYRSLPTMADGSTDLASPALAWEEVGRYSESQIETCLGADWHTGSGNAHQMLNFVRSGLDDQLWLIGARNTTSLPSGSDMLDLYRVGVSEDGTPEDCVLRHVRSTRMTSYPYMGGGDSANFAAASGVYVSPTGELLVYAAEYENKGPRTLNPDGTRGRRTVRFAEYRHRDVVRPDSPTLRPTVTIDGGNTIWVDEGDSTVISGSGSGPTTQAWIQLFEDDGAGRSVPRITNDEWLLADYVDRDADDFDDLEQVSRIDENAGSWRWFAPNGCTIHANDYSVGQPGFPGPDTVLLHGTGQVHEETDLDRIGYDDDVGSVTFGDDCDAYYDATIEVEWDADGNGSYESHGATVPFDAARLDGPTTHQIAARALHPTDPGPLGVGVPTSIEVQVRNVAPTVTSMVLRDPTGNAVGGTVPVVLAGQPVQLEVEFSDPGYYDTQTAQVFWGDGTVETTFDEFSDARYGALGVLRHRHTFAEPGSYRVMVSVRDDDGGVDLEYRWIEVVAPADAIEVVVERIDVALAAADDPIVAAALVRAREALAGNLGGHADNGALYALEAGDVATAITKLAAAIGHLEAAEEAGATELSPLKDLLGQVAGVLARDSLDQATAAVEPPSKGQQRQLDAIAALIAEGDTLLTSGQHAAACDRYRQAVEKSLQLAG